jgi:hypothetical protein
MRTRYSHTKSALTQTKPLACVVPVQVGIYWHLCTNKCWSEVQVRAGEKTEDWDKQRKGEEWNQRKREVRVAKRRKRKRREDRRQHEPSFCLVL